MFWWFLLIQNVVNYWAFFEVSALLGCVPVLALTLCLCTQNWNTPTGEFTLAWYGSVARLGCALSRSGSCLPGRVVMLMMTGLLFLQVMASSMLW